MSIAEVNRITGKGYTLEQIYGKKYVAFLTDEDRREFDNGASELRVDDNVRKDRPKACHEATDAHWHTDMHYKSWSSDRSGLS